MAGIRNRPLRQKDANLNVMASNSLTPPEFAKKKRAISILDPGVPKKTYGPTPLYIETRYCQGIKGRRKHLLPDRWTGKGGETRSGPFRPGPGAGNATGPPGGFQKEEGNVHHGHLLEKKKHPFLRADARNAVRPPSNWANQSHQPHP